MSLIRGCTVLFCYYFPFVMVIFDLSVFLHKPPVKLSICKKYTYNLYIPHNSSVTCIVLGVLTVSCGAALEYTEKQPRKYSAKPYEGMRAMNNDTEKGYLKISVTEAGGTIPIKGACRYNGIRRRRRRERQCTVLTHDGRRRIHPDSSS